MSYPTTTLFHHSATGLIIGNAAAAAASTYICTEGNFGNNFTNESTSNWGPGTAFAPGSPNSCAIVGGSNEGYRWTLSTVPVPGAVWLFGCALGLMGVMRRKISS